MLDVQHESPRHRRAVAALLKGGAMLGLATTGSNADAQQKTAAPASLVLDRVTVVDVERGALVPDQRVVIVGNRAQGVGRRDKVAAPLGASVVDAEGKYLIPGLWDSHVHTSGPQMEALLLANGVTRVRDALSDLPLDTLVRWRREILAEDRADSGSAIAASWANDVHAPGR